MQDSELNFHIDTRVLPILLFQSNTFPLTHASRPPKAGEQASLPIGITLIATCLVILILCDTKHHHETYPNYNYGPTPKARHIKASHLGKDRDSSRPDGDTTGPTA